LASYYYLISSLPTLQFEMKAPFTSEQFLSLCKEHLSKRDLAAIKTLLGVSDGQVKHRYVQKWLDYQNGLKASLVEMRLSKLNKSAEGLKLKSKFDVASAEVVKSALQAGNPLEAELILMRHQFKKASMLSQATYFEAEVLMNYAVQLKILERKDLFVKEKGEKEFEHLFTTLQTDIRSK
jgi:hypothetical protein